MTDQKRPKEHIGMIPRIALTREEAAAALGMGSVDSFERYVQPHVRMIRRGRLRLVSVQELERWTNESAEEPLRICSVRQDNRRDWPARRWNDRGPRPTRRNP